MADIKILDLWGENRNKDRVWKRKREMAHRTEWGAEGRCQEEK